MALHSNVAKLSNIHLNHFSDVKMKITQPFIQVSHFDFKKTQAKVSEAKTIILVSSHLYGGKCMLNVKGKSLKVPEGYKQ